MAGAEGRAVLTSAWTRIDQRLLEGVLIAVAIGAVAAGVLIGVHGATTDRLEARLHMDREGVGAMAGEAPMAVVDGTRYIFAASGVTLHVEDPTRWQRLLTAVPGVLVACVVAVVAMLLWQVARCAGRGHLFGRTSARLLLTAAIVVLVGGLAASLISAFARLSLARGAPTALGTPADAAGAGMSVALLPAVAMAAVVSMVLAILAQAFRQAARLREEVEGLV
jgi:hypothetical protein